MTINVCVASAIPKPPTAMHTGFTHRFEECDLQSSLQPINSWIILAGLVLLICSFRFERFLVYYTLNLKCSRVLQTSIYHFQYVYQLGTEKRKLILDISPKQKSCFQHTFQTDFSLFFPLCALNSWKLSVSRISLLIHKPVGRDPFLWLQWADMIGTAWLNLQGWSYVVKISMVCTKTWGTHTHILVLPSIPPMTVQNSHNF